MSTHGITTGDLLRAFWVHGYEVKYSDLTNAIRYLHIKVKSRVVHGMKIAAYLNSQDVRDVVGYMNIDLRGI